MSESIRLPRGSCVIPIHLFEELYALKMKYQLGLIVDADPPQVAGKGDRVDPYGGAGEDVELEPDAPPSIDIDALTSGLPSDWKSVTKKAPQRTPDQPTSQPVGGK